jgi:translation initiation factor 1 (eIF-1/SUI1)
MTAQSVVNNNPLRTRTDEHEPQHNINLTVRIRDDNKPYGKGTTILFKGDDDVTSFDKMAKWILDAWCSGGTQ